MICFGDLALRALSCTGWNVMECDGTCGSETMELICMWNEPLNLEVDTPIYSLEDKVSQHWIYYLTHIQPIFQAISNKLHTVMI